MSRNNTPETPSTVREMAVFFEARAKELRDLAKRWEAEFPDEVIHIAHRAGIDTGMLGVMKFIREGGIKLNSLADVKRMDEFRRSRLTLPERQTVVAGSASKRR